MKVLFLFGTIFGSLSMINAACTESTSIRIEVKYLIFEPANLIEAILTAPMLRTDAQKTLIDNEIKAIKQLVSIIMVVFLLRFDL